MIPFSWTRIFLGGGARKTGDGAEVRETRVGGNEIGNRNGDGNKDNGKGCASNERDGDRETWAFRDAVLHAQDFWEEEQLRPIGDRRSLEKIVGIVANYYGVSPERIVTILTNRVRARDPRDGDGGGIPLIDLT